MQKNGNYTIPLNNLRTSDLNSYYVINENSKINILATSENLSSMANLSKDQISPVPIITLSHSYDFSENIKINSTTARRNDIKFPEFESEINEPSISPEPSLTKAP